MMHRGGGALLSWDVDMMANVASPDVKVSSQALHYNVTVRFNVAVFRALGL